MTEKIIKYIGDKMRPYIIYSLFSCYLYASQSTDEVTGTRFLKQLA